MCCVKGQRPRQYRWSRCPRLKGLPSTRRCSGRGRGRGLLFLAERARADPSPGLRGRAVVVPSSLRTRNHHAATVAGARHVPVGRTVLVESVCRQGGTHSGAVPTGRGSKGVAPQRGWHSSQRPHLQKVGYGSARNSLADTRARRPYDGCAAVARLPSHMPRRAI